MTDAQSQQRLQQTLQSLHDQLEDTDSVDPQVQQLLRDTLLEIQEVLDSQSKEAQPETKSEEEGSKSLADRLSDSAHHFEESHPTVASTVGRLADILAQMGI